MPALRMDPSEKTAAAAATQHEESFEAATGKKMGVCDAEGGAKATAGN